jgi:uncharacterized protein (TIGR00725 family)
MPQIIIGVMGPGVTATPDQLETAYALGYALAAAGWAVLTGGRAVGVMTPPVKGLRRQRGVTIGILPSADGADMSAAVDIPIVTGLGDGRNVVNVLSSQVVVACGLGSGTASEIALALKAKKPLILMAMDPRASSLWQGLATSPVVIAATADAAVAQIHQWLDANDRIS